MSRIETTVQMLTLVLAASLSFSVLAAESSDKEKSTVDCPKSAAEDVKYYVSTGGKFKTDKEKSDYYQKSLSACRGGGDEKSCQKAEGELTAAESKYTGACSAAGLTDSSMTAGDIGCNKKLKACEKAQGITGDEDEDSLYDSGRLKEQLEYCPTPAAFGGPDLKELKDEMKDAKEDVKSAKEALPDLESAVTDAAAQAQDGEVEIAEQETQARAEYRDSKAALEDKVSEQNRERFQQIQQMQTELTNMSAQIAEQENAKKAAGLNFNSDVYDLTLQCHAQALAKVNQRRAEVLQRVATSTESQADMNALFKSGAGKTTRKADQERAHEHFLHCMGDASTTFLRKKAEEKRDFAIGAAQTQIDGLKIAQAGLQQQIGEKQNNEKAQDVQTATRDLANIEQGYQERLTLFGQKRQQAMVKSFNAQMTAGKALAAKKQELAEAESSYRNIKDYYRTMNSAAGSTGSKEKFFEALSGKADFDGKAQSFLLTCCGDLAKFAGTCNRMKTYLNLQGISAGPTEVGVEASTAATETEAPAAEPAKDPKAKAADPKAKKQTDKKKVKNLKAKPAPGATINGRILDKKPMSPPQKFGPPAAQ